MHGKNLKIPFHPSSYIIQLHFSSPHVPVYGPQASIDREPYRVGNPHLVGVNMLFEIELVMICSEVGFAVQNDPCFGVENEPPAFRTNDLLHIHIYIYILWFHPQR